MREISRGTSVVSKLLSLLGVVSVVLAIVFLSNKASDAQEPSIEKTGPSQELFKRGEALYQKQCSICHGVQGNGDGKAAYLLNPKPRNLSNSKFMLISTTDRQATDSDLFKVIARGMAGSSMPPWEHLNENDRWALVHYIRYLSGISDLKKSGEITEEMANQGLPWESIQKIFNERISSQNTIIIPEEPAITQEALNKGRTLYIESCAGCHGAEGRGDGRQNMVDDQGLLTRPRDLTAGVFKGDSSSKELYFRMIAGMPGSPMPSYNEVFTQEQIWDVIHFVQSLVPEEKKEKTRLKQMMIKAQKISDDVDMNPFTQQWTNIKPAYVSLTPLWWRDNRIEGVDVRAVYNDEQIAFQLSWSDPQKNDNLVRVQSFSDGAALQFSAEEDPPFFGMGSLKQPVHIWHWKAGWEQKGDERPDIETQYPNTATDFYEFQKNYEHGTAFELADSKTKFHSPEHTTGWGAGNPISDPHKKEAAEEGISEGMGSYTAQRPSVEKTDARGVWANGKWHVVLVRSLKSSEKDALQFKPGEPLSVAIAVWDGESNDRNGQKMVSIWNNLILE